MSAPLAVGLLVTIGVHVNGHLLVVVVPDGKRQYSK